MLAFDFGTRRIGVAVGNTLTGSARALATVDSADASVRAREIDALVAQWQPQVLVVGVPVHADGTPHAMTARARRFARELRERLNLPVEEADERHTTELAQAQVQGRGRKGRAARDQVAAQIILQGWLDDDAGTA